MLVAVYYQTFVLDSISASLTGIPVGLLHTVGTRRVAVGENSFSLVHKSMNTFGSRPKYE